MTLRLFPVRASMSRAWSAGAVRCDPKELVREFAGLANRFGPLPIRRVPWEIEFLTTHFRVRYQCSLNGACGIVAAACHTTASTSYIGTEGRLVRFKANSARVGSLTKPRNNVR
jgi:hypothetical protein